MSTTISDAKYTSLQSSAIKTDMEESNSNLGTLLNMHKQYGVNEGINYSTTSYSYNGPTPPPGFNRRWYSVETNRETFENHHLDSSYNKIQTLRSELDQKLKELYNTQDSIYSEYQYQYDTSIYTTIMWTVLTTSIIYFVFIKL